MYLPWDLNHVAVITVAAIQNFVLYVFLFQMCAQKVAGVMAELFSHAHQEHITVLMGPNLRKPAGPAPWVTIVKRAAQSVLTHLFVQQAITAPLEQNSRINSLVLLAHTTQT